LTSSLAPRPRLGLAARSTSAISMAIKKAEQISLRQTMLEHMSFSNQLPWGLWKEELLRVLCGRVVLQRRLRSTVTSPKSCGGAEWSGPCSRLTS
jgi:hypothetical protein